ncbi:MAG: hypothetical protein R3338_01065 [Thermoanaerobaculia bacterium]|nr:hypothetical protein [Thermoanaerobaculia bacterium]
MQKIFRPKTLVIAILAISFATAAFAQGDRIEWAISDGDHRTIVSTSPHGHQALQALESEIDGPFIWLRRDGQSYVITDPATVEKARAIFDDLETIEEREIAISIDAERIEKTIDREIEREMERLEERMGEIESRVEAGSFESIREIEAVISDLELERIAEVAMEIEKSVEQIEIDAEGIEAWAEELERRIDDEAIPLFENAIRRGVARPLD